MIITIIATRKNIRTGEVFKTLHTVEHQPVKLSPNVAGWQDTQKTAGLSETDIDNIANALKTTACNIHNLQIDICSQ